MTPDGGKRWRLKYRFGGKEKRISLGVYPKVTLKQAREAANSAKESLESGVDPSKTRKLQKDRAEFTFKDLAELWIEKHCSEVQKKTSDKTKVFFSKISDNSILRESPDKINPKDILILCKEIEKNISTVSAHYLLSILSRIFRFGVVSGYVQSDPCRDIRGGLTTHKVKHYSAITEPVDLGKFLLSIETCNSSYVIRSAIMMQLLCMSRPTETRFLKWDEIDFETKLIRIPAERMKKSRDHLIPLSTQATRILLKIKKRELPSIYVFPKHVKSEHDAPIGRATIPDTLRNLGYGGDIMVAHGFRSTASTLLNEMGWPPDVIEAQLAHAIPGVRAVYNRAVYLDERRRMLQAWADYLDELKMKAAPV